MSAFYFLVLLAVIGLVALGIAAHIFVRAIDQIGRKGE